MATVDILGIHLPHVQSILATVRPILVCQDIVAGQQRILTISSVQQMHTDHGHAHLVYEILSISGQFIYTQLYYVRYSMVVLYSRDRDGLSYSGQQCYPKASLFFLSWQLGSIC